jgi:hypothetical protein
MRCTPVRSASSVKVTPRLFGAAQNMHPL